MPINRMATQDFIKVKERNRLQSLVTDQTPNCDPESIREVRDFFIKDYEAHPDLYDETDVERVKTSDWTVSRFLLRKKLNVPDSAQMLVDCMKWRHRLGMPRWKDSDFPEEFYKIGAIFPYEEDRLGNTVIYVRARLYNSKLECVEELLQRFLIHIANRVDNERDGRGMAIVFDCTGANYSNVNMSMLWFMIKEVVPHLPKGLNYVLIYHLPWLLKATLSMATNLLPAEYSKLIHQAGSKDINQWIAKENLPDFMGGTCERNYRRAPLGCKGVADLMDEYNITQEQVDTILKVYAPYLDEADRAVAARKKNIRRRSSTMKLWYWINNKPENDSNDDRPITDGDQQHPITLSSQTNGGRKISGSNKTKLAIIQDEKEQ